MQCIYHTIDPTHPQTVILAQNGPPVFIKRLSYQVDQSGYKPSTLILSLREDLQGDTRFITNLNNMNVHELQKIRFSVPEETGSAARQLREHVVDSVREREEVEEARRQKEQLCLQKAREEHQERVQVFYRCLIEKGLLGEGHAKELSNESRDCPLCSARLMSCGACRAISCSSGVCKASSSIPIVKCQTHPLRNSCTSCLESQPGSLPRMGQCPICAHWFCSTELSWCPGRPLPNEGTGDIELSSSNIGVSGTVTRLHPMRPISCQSPACKTTSEEGQRAGRQCSNTHCWSAPMATRLVCPDCTTHDSVSCPCGRYWMCGSCELQSPSSCFDVPVTCPRCHRSFCPSCSYIDDCMLCGRGGLCNDCMEEEDILDVQVVNILNKCGSCEGHLCEACNDHNERSCDKCYRRMCMVCGYKSDVCERCTDRSDVFESDEDDFGLLSFGSDDEMAWHGVY